MSRPAAFPMSSGVSARQSGKLASVNGQFREDHRARLLRIIRAHALQPFSDNDLLSELQRRAMRRVDTLLA
ncbi:hypothetical protein [Arthrobacter methylotrophus]|uniref:hypothetical protein n=1 Tax=Arthrobacter methylotrophus TaxID=121291 RepID=UPI0031EADF28